MTPVISSSTNNIFLIHVTPFTTRRTQCLKRRNLLRICAKQTLSSQKIILPLSTSVRLLSQSRSGLFLQLKSRTDITCGTGTETDVTIEEADSPVADEDSGATSEIPTDSVGRSEELHVKLDASVLPAQTKHLRPAMKSETLLVNPEELVPGALFTGKVIAIVSFGVFVDFGAFTNGLVHISQLSDDFVRDVGDIVSVGQEVKVKLMEANMETRLIYLTMREIDGTNNMQKRKDSPASSGKGRPPRKSIPRSDQKRADGNQSFSKFVTGQDFVGTVKNVNRLGSFISLPNGEEGFLPLAEQATDGFGDLESGESSLEVGQEVSVRVLRIAHAQVTLTMKREEDEAVGEFDVEVYHGVIHKATNPFMLAFRKDKDIAAFLDEREKTSLIETDLNNVQDQQTSSSESDKIGGKFELSGTEVDEVRDHQESVSNRLASTLTVEDETSSKEVDVKASIVDASNENVNGIKDPEIIVFESSDGINEAVIEQVTESRSEILAPQESASASDQLSEKAPAVDQSSSKNQANQDVAQFSMSSENIVPDSLQSIDNVATSIEEKEEVIFDAMSSESVGSAVEEVSAAVVLENMDLSAQVTDSIMSNTAISEEIVSVSDQLTEEAPADQAGEEVAQLANNGGLRENTGFDSLRSVDSVAESLEQKLVVSTEILSPEGDGSSFDEASTTDGLESERKADLSWQKIDSITPDSAIREEVTEIRADDAIASDEVQMAKPNAAIELISAIVVEEVGINLNSNESITSSNDQVDVPAVHQSMNEDGEISSATFVKDEKAGSVPDKNGTVTNSNDQSCTSSPKESTIAAASISPALVKQLRDETGAALMDCKKALSETGVDLVKAQEFLRKRGLTNAAKKASRETVQGRIGAYVHNSQIGVLIEVNCETDFVSRGEIFTEFVDDLAMQVAACPQVQYLVTDDVPRETVEKEREIEMQKEDLLLKPEQMRSRIVDGRIRKRVEKMALLEQPYIKNDKLAVKDWVKQTIATVGENIKVKRFVRFNLGEGLEKKSQDFAAEVAARTAVTSVVPPSPGEAQPAVVETVDKAPKVAVSAALVKQLREETSAGMMDCKKALSETGGDLNEAQEYLRKKGLSTADKKFSCLAAEGMIGSYIHDSCMGVLIEVNSETDFVGRAEKFKELVDDLSMQIVACPQVQYVSMEDIPESIVSKEKEETEMQRDDLQTIPEEDTRERIVKGRISKRLEELALLEQPFMKNDSILVKDLVKQTVAALGENMKVRRFVRFTLGETAETPIL